MWRDLMLGQYIGEYSGVNNALRISKKVSHKMQLKLWCFYCWAAAVFRSFYGNNLFVIGLLVFIWMFETMVWVLLVWTVYWIFYKLYKEMYWIFLFKIDLKVHFVIPCHASCNVSFCSNCTQCIEYDISNSVILQF